MPWQQVIGNLSVDINIHKVVKIKQVCCFFAINKCFGMIDIGQKGVEGNTGMASSTPSMRLISVASLYS
jgi:hypothetical protein